VSRDGCTFGLIWPHLAYFVHAVPIASPKKKHGHETKREMVVFISTAQFIVTDPANSDISHIDAFNHCTYALAK